MIGLSPCFVCRGQYWLVYLPMLYVMNKNCWYISSIGVGLGSMTSQDGGQDGRSKMAAMAPS